MWREYLQNVHIYCFTFPFPITLKSLFSCVYIVHAQPVVFAHWSGEKKHSISRCDKGLMSDKQSMNLD